MITLESPCDYERTLARISELKAISIVDGPDAAELVALLTAVEEWEASHDISPLEKAKPSDLAT